MNLACVKSAIAVVGLVGMGGCAQGQEPDPPRPRFHVQPVAAPLYRPGHADRNALPDVVRANNAFAVHLYHKLRSEPGNILVSPAALTASLGLLRAGARGETADEIDHALHRRGPSTDHALAALVQDLSADGDQNSFQIRLANAVWVQREYPVLDDYQAAIRDVFALADDFRVDFTGHPADAAQTINSWVAGRTGRKIVGAIQPDAVAPPTKLAVTSAIYFRANWVDGFQRRNTRDGVFHVTRSRSVTVPMMSKYGYGVIRSFFDAGQFTVLSLSCGRGEYALAVLLPKQVDGLPDLEATLAPDALDALWPKLKTPPEIRINLPRFCLRTSRPLRPVLTALGISRAFDREQADFSGINGRERDLFVKSVTHETFLDVNEEGIEAAALSGIISSDGDADDPPPVVLVDHPFLFLVRDTRSGCIVFLGRVIDPT